VFLINADLGQEPVADGLEHRVDRLGPLVRQRDRAPARLSWPPPSQALHDVAEHLARVAAELRDADGQLHQVLKDPDGQDPVHLVEPDEEVGQLGDDVGLRHHAAPAHDDVR